MALAGITDPLDITEHLSIEMRQLLIIDVDDIAPIPLHAQHGGSGHPLILGEKAAVFEHGSEPAGEYASELAEVLLSNVGAAPAPFHGGAFSNKKCHKIFEKLESLCALLDKHVSPAQARAYRNARVLWASLIPVVNRAENSGPPEERPSFRERVAELVGKIVADFQWCSVTPQFYVLCCDAPDFVDRHGSIDRFNQ